MLLSNYVFVGLQVIENLIKLIKLGDCNDLSVMNKNFNWELFSTDQYIIMTNSLLGNSKKKLWRFIILICPSNVNQNCEIIHFYAGIIWYSLIEYLALISVEYNVERGLFNRSMFGKTVSRIWRGIVSNIKVNRYQFQLLVNFVSDSIRYAQQ